MKEIMLNKSFIGSWGAEHEENIPHEIINLFRTDKGELYIYVPPYGGFDTVKHQNVEYLLLTGNWSNRTTEILYLVTGLKLLHNGGKRATLSDRATEKKLINNNNIKYGGKFLYEINLEDFVHYFTFQAEKIVKPKKNMYFTWDASKEEHSETCDIFVLQEDYKYQRQYGFISESEKVVKNVIENKEYWDDTDIAQYISLEKKDAFIEGKSNELNFLKLIHKEYDETIFTNLFYEFFSAVPEMFNLFAKKILQIEFDDKYTIRKEVPTADGKGRLDLLAIGKKNIVVIENKIKSGLNGIDKHNELSQLTHYIKFIEKEYSQLKPYYFLFEPSYNDIDISRFDKDRGEEFKKINYKKIYIFFSSNIKAFKRALENHPYNAYIDDFISALYTHTLTMGEVVERRFLEAIYGNSIEK